MDLCIKSIYYLGRPPARIVSSQLALSYHVVLELLTFLKREQMCEVVGSNGIGEQNYKYALTSKGNEKAEEVLERGRYMGAAPIPFQTYVELVARQSVKRLSVDSEGVEAVLSRLVLGEGALRAVGPAL